MKVDLHIHSSASHDAINSPRAICRAALRNGLDGIALTDHDTTAGWDEMRRTAGKLGLLFIPGMERTVIARGRTVGEVLCLFLSEPVRSQDPAGIVREVWRQGGLVAAAHPFDRRRPALGRCSVLPEFGSDIALEVLNGRSYGRKANRSASSYASAHGLARVAGSDAHTPFEVGRACVEADAGTAEGLKREILERRLRVWGSTSHPVFSLYSGMRKLDVHRRHSDFAGPDLGTAGGVACASADPVPPVPRIRRA